MKKYFFALILIGLFASTSVSAIAETYNRHLQIAVEEASKITNEELDSLIPIVYEEFVCSLDNATYMLKNSSSQDEIDLAFERLANAMHMLSFKKPDKTNLINLINDSYGLNESIYEEQSWQAFSSAFTEAIRVNEDENSLEDEVEQITQTLINAKNSLVKKPILVENVVKIEEDYNSESTKEINTTKNPEKEIIEHEPLASEEAILPPDNDVDIKISREEETTEYDTTSTEVFSIDSQPTKISTVTNEKNENKKLESVNHKDSVLYIRNVNLLATSKNFNRNVEYIINPDLVIR